MRQDVVCDDQVRRPPLRKQSTSGGAPKERDLGLHPSLTQSGQGTIHCGIDTEARDAALDEILQEIAVIAGNLNDTRLRPERKLLHGPIDVTAGMREPCVRIRRKIHIASVKMGIGRLEVFELYEPARFARVRPQRIEFLAM